MTTITLKEVKKKAELYDSSLLATDNRFRRAVTIQHQDGSILYFNHAFLMRIEDWVACFTEHHGVHIYHSEDLYSYEEHTRRREAIEVLP